MIPSFEQPAMSAMNFIKQRESDITNFFTQTSVPRQTCDDWLRRRFRQGNFAPIPEQGRNSYSVHVGQDQELVVQFRLKTLPLDMDAINSAQRVYGDKVPVVMLEAQLGEDGGENSKPPLLVYSVDGVRGTRYSSFLQNRGEPMLSSREMNAACRRNLTRDFAR